MNTLPKSLTIAFLSLYIFISGLSADLVRAQSSAPEPMVTLTPEEKAWLIENPHIKLATLTNQPPFSMLDADRNHSGILRQRLTRSIPNRRDLIRGDIGHSGRNVVPTK
jgi:hypothetical protein